MVRALDSRFERSRVRFPAVPLRCMVRVVTPCDGKVTVSLASRWPCIINFSDLRARGLRKRDNTPPTLLMEHGTFYLLRSREEQMSDTRGTCRRVVKTEPVI